MWRYPAFTSFLVAGLLISGCQTQPPEIPLVPSSGGTDKTGKAMVGDGALVSPSEYQKSLEAVQKTCDSQLTYYEDASRQGAKRAYSLSIAGLVAGSVLAPALTAANAAANAAWIAGFSGIAGGTHYAVQSLRNTGLSGNQITKVRNRIAANAKAEMNAALKAKTVDDFYRHVRAAQLECILYEVHEPGLPETDYDVTPENGSDSDSGESQDDSGA